MAAFALGVVFGGCPGLFALNPSLDISQYAHTTWRVRDGFSLGNIYAMAQTPDGYLWFATEFGLVRFDGVRRVAWEPPAGQHLPDKGAYSLLVTRDGTLWIGTFSGLASWDGARLTQYPELDGKFVTSMLRGSGGNGVGRLIGQHGGNSDRPAVRNPKRARAMLLATMAPSVRSSGVWLRTAQALSGPVLNPGFGDGSLVLLSAIRCRRCGSAT